VQGVGTCSFIFKIHTSQLVVIHVERLRLHWAMRIEKVVQFTWLFCLVSYNFLMYSSPKMAVAIQVNAFFSLPEMIPDILAQY
jgi:hypothetical protein